MYWFSLISDICPHWLSHTAQPSHWLTRILPIPLLIQYLPSVLPGSDIKLDMTTEYFITVEQGWARDGGPRGGAGGRQLPHGHGEVQVHSSRKE